MLPLPAHRAIRVLTSGALALCAIFLAAEPIWALCEVIDFSASKQRTRSTIDGSTVSTLVATPAAAPGDSVLLEADFGCVVGEGFDPTPANNVVTVEVLKSVGGAFAASSLPTSFESFEVPAANVQVSGCVGSSCNALAFEMPLSTPILYAGPARITVTRGASVVARVFELGARTASCDVDAPDPLFGTFTLLPPYNLLLVSPEGAPNTGLLGGIAGNGSLMVPVRYPLVGKAAVDASATRSTGPEIAKIPDERFVRSFSRLFRPLPAIHRLIGSGSGKALYATADVPRGTLQLLQMVDPGLPSEVSYPDNFHDLRDGAAGPVILNPVDPVSVRFEGVSPVLALRSSDEAVALGLSEQLLVNDLNLDADTTDLLLSATDTSTGVTANTGQAIAQVAASPARPVVAVVDDVVAFLQSEALSGNLDLNGDLQADDLVMRALKGAVALNAGAPVDTSAHPLRAIDGSQLAISQGFVFFRTPEDATAPHSTQRVSDTGGTGGSDTSEQPSIDGPGTRVAYASRAANLAAGTDGAHSQILVSDRLSGIHTLVSAGSSGAGNADSFDAAISRDGDHAAFASLASNLSNGSGSEQVVWERGVNVEGSSAFGLSFATFGLASGEEDVPGVNYSPCTASSPGISLSFANDGTVTGFLATASGGGCAFSADFVGSYSISPLPVQVGSVLTVDAALTDFNGVPPLPGELSDLRLFAQNTVTDVHPVSFEFSGSFALLANVGVPSSVAQVFARVLGGGAPVQLVSAALGGGGGDSASGQPAVSGDGQLVAFTSAASDLVASDSNNVSDVFMRDLGLDSTERVSVTSAEGQGNGASSEPALTPDGNSVAFTSLATNLVAGADTNGASDVFLRDRNAGTTERLSVAAPGGSTSGASAAPDVSDDGRYAVFESAAALAQGDSNGVTDIYLRDRVAKTTERVSVKSGGEQVLDGSFDPSLSGDGSFIVFTSLASLVPGAPDGTNVYRRNRVTGTVELLSAGAGEGDSSTSADANADGRTVAFASDASLVMNDSLPVDVFVRSTGFGTDLNGDEDDLDTVFQSFATDPLPGLQCGTTAPLPGLQCGARVAAAAASTGFGRALVSVPEADQGATNLNLTSLIQGAGADGDTDTADRVLHLFDGASGGLVNLGIAGTQGALSDTTLCALVDEAQQNGTNLGGPNGAIDQVLVAGDVAALLSSPTTQSLTNVGIAATQVHVAGTVCVFTTSAGSVLEFYDLATGKHVSSGLTATAVQVGPGPSPLIAFRVPENLDLNGDGDDDDEVMHVVALRAVTDAADGAVITSDVTNLGLEAIECSLPGCEAFRFGSILPNGAVSFLGTEPGETVDPQDCLPTSQTKCDFDGDGDGLDTVVHYVQTVATGSLLDVTSVGSLALSSTGLQDVPPFGEQGPQGTHIQLTECEVAKLVCPETRNKVSDPIGPPLTDCEADADVDRDGVLDCTTLRNYLGPDSDRDGPMDVFDNAPDTANTEQGDADGDGVGNVVDTVASVPPCEQSCDLNENGSIDQDDVDAILAAIAGGEVPQGGALSEECGDRRDRNANRRFDFNDASLCKADCHRPDCSPPPLAPFSAPAASGPGCGIGIELAVLVPLLMAARRMRRRAS